MNQVTENEALTKLAEYDTKLREHGGDEFWLTCFFQDSATVGNFTLFTYNWDLRTLESIVLTDMKILKPSQLKKEYDGYTRFKATVFYKDGVYQVQYSAVLIEDDEQFLHVQAGYYDIDGKLVYLQE